MIDIVNGLLVRDQEVLMAHRSPSRSNYPGTWSFPGGHVEDGETLEDALRRELLEEIGVLAKSWFFIKQFKDLTSNPDKPVSFHFFVVNDWNGEPINIGEEHTQICWVKFADAIQMKDLTFSSYVDLLEMLANA